MENRLQVKLIEFGLDILSHSGDIKKVFNLQICHSYNHR